MKIALIYRVNRAIPSNEGVLLKMRGQHDAFLSLGHSCTSYFHHNGEIFRVENKDEEKLVTQVPYRKLKFSLRSFFQVLSSEDSLEDVDLIYVRYPYSTASFLSFLDRFKTNKVVIEMPTYPYADEWSGLKKGFLLMDSFYRKRLKTYCSAIVHFGKEKELFGIQTIRTSNGIDVLSVPLKKDFQQEELAMIFVGKLASWHGLDRILVGLKDFKRNYKLRIVGDGPALESLKGLVSRLGIGQNISFHGSLKGASLNELFDQSNLGIGTMGIHRKGVLINSSLKHRSYASRGLPFIYSSEDLDFPIDCGFVQIAGPSDGPIDINGMEKFVKNCEVSGSTIRQYAEDQLDWKKKMQMVLENLIS